MDILINPSAKTPAVNDIGILCGNYFIPTKKMSAETVNLNNGPVYQNALAETTFDGVPCRRFNCAGIEIADKSPAPTGVEPWTMSIWFNAVTLKDAALFGFGNYSDAEAWLWAGADGRYSVNHYDSGYTLDPLKIYQAGEWHNLLATYDGTNSIGYVDGVFAGFRQVNLSIASDSYFSIGHLGRYNALSFDGYLAMARLYNRVLNRSEIAELANEFSVV